MSDGQSDSQKYIDSSGDLFQRIKTRLHSFARLHGEDGENLGDSDLSLLLEAAEEIARLRGRSIPDESETMAPDPPDKCDLRRLEGRVALLERDKCQQRNCILAVNLAHAMRRAAALAEDVGQTEIAHWLRTAMKNAGA